MRGSRSLKFAGNPQRIIILEGSPSAELGLLAQTIKQEIPDQCKTIVFPADLDKRDWHAEELVDEILEVITTEPEKIIVIARLSLPEHHAKADQEQIQIYNQLEVELNDYPSFAFFMLGTRHYFIKQNNNDIGLGLLDMEKQSEYEQAYKSTKYARKLFLQATGYNISSLATTVLFQSDVYIRNPDLNWDETD